MWHFLLWVFLLDKSRRMTRHEQSRRSENISDDLTDPWYKHPILPHVLGFFVILVIGLALMALFI